MKCSGIPEKILSIFVTVLYAEHYNNTLPSLLSLQNYFSLMMKCLLSFLCLKCYVP